MKKILALVLFVVMCFALAACGQSFKAEKESLVGTKWFSATDTSNSLVVWDFYEESVEKTEYFFDGNGIHESSKEAADYEVQKDVVKVKFTEGEELIPYTSENGKAVLKKGEFFTPEEIEEGIQGFWNLRKSEYIIGMLSTNEYNVQFDNGTVIIESAADAYGEAPGVYYYYGPYEGTYTIGDGTFETEAKHGDDYFFNVYGGKVNVFHYGEEMQRGTGLPGSEGYEFN